MRQAMGCGVILTDRQRYAIGAMSRATLSWDGVDLLWYSAVTPRWRCYYAGIYGRFALKQWDQRPTSRPRPGPGRSQSVTR
jgi:hypothetical protein